VPKPASISNGSGTEAIASLQARNASSFSAGVPSGSSGRAAIPAWQMAAANKSSTAAAAVDGISSTREATEGA